MESVLQSYLDGLMVWLPKVGLAIFVFFVFFMLSKMIKRVITKVSCGLKLDEHIAVLVSRIIGVLLLLFGVISALGVLGVNVSAMIAGLGLTGFALGFALKDTISNILSGVLILLHQPFEMGDHIKIAGFEGDVVAIDLRYTELAKDGDKILIPNAKLFTNPIIVCNVPESKCLDSH
ncbi:MAG: mechanosensitive ion channel [Thiotrichales bacterium]|nr:mechanosensitive ion channel [Thiotrichales bacterium]